MPNLRQNGVTTTHKDKHGGNLKSDYIVHIAFQKSLDKWKSKLKKCLETAEKKKMKSLSIPVLGTGWYAVTTDLHYENLPMQYTGIFFKRKKMKFHQKNVIF